MNKRNSTTTVHLFSLVSRPTAIWRKARRKVDQWGSVVTDKTLMTSVPGLFAAGDVRTDLLKQAGLPIPKTYDELLNAARVLTRDGMYGIALPAE